ncbi:hypothetical protein [Undibacterium sp. TS12]|uniref:hypothetical protein n=1 Tax=Undibacterium sp. TS12 TaxID=2908202 RepID=UPI001F4CFBB4|nr:hypothetical protein [Undibacterium sp. TS12]MCH8621587.1 hypothetical protein [Undibacterium sp. TS12]
MHDLLLKNQIQEAISSGLAKGIADNTSNYTYRGRVGGVFEVAVAVAVVDFSF